MRARDSFGDLFIVPGYIIRAWFTTHMHIVLSSPQLRNFPVGLCTDRLDD